MEGHGVNHSVRFPALLRIPLLEDLPADVARGILDSCRMCQVPAGVELMSQGSLSPGLVIIASGMVEINVLNDSGDQTILHEVGAGETMGEVECVAQRPCVASCITRLPTQYLLRTPQQLHADLMAPLVQRNLARIFSDRLARDNAQKLVDRFLPVESRICSYLLRLARRQSLITRSQSYLAQAVGCSRQTMNRTLGQLRDEGLVDVRNSRIEILDREGLERRIEGMRPE